MVRWTYNVNDAATFVKVESDRRRMIKEIVGQCRARASEHVGRVDLEPGGHGHAARRVIEASRSHGHGGGH